MKEEWRKIEGFPRYEISNYGNMISWCNGSGKGKRNKSRKIVFGKLKVGHKYKLLWKDGEYYPKLIHRLVLETFVGPCPPGMQACHNDSNPGNNRTDNLRWDTPIGNSIDRIKNGTRRDVTKNAIFRLRMKLNLSQKQFAEKLKIPKGVIPSWENSRHKPWEKYRKVLESLGEKHGIEMEWGKQDEWRRENSKTYSPAKPF